MSLASRCQDNFDESSRAYGKLDFERRRVQLLDVDEFGVDALVGWGAKKHEVSILWNGDQRELEADCDCRDNSLCRHVWATLLTMDDEGVGACFNGTHPLEVWRLMDYDDDDAGPGSPNVLSYSPQARPPRDKTPAWQRQLQSAAEQQAPNGRTGELWRELSGKRCRLWYILNLSDCLANQSLAVEFFQQDVKKNGDWGKAKRRSIPRDRISNLTDPQDRQLVSILLGNEARDGGPFNSYHAYYLASQATSSCTISAAMYDTILPRLCATGRLAWLLDSSLPVEDATPVGWDDGPAWEFRLLIASDPEHGSWRIGGELYRGDETANVEDAIFTTGDGLVMFRHAIARFDGEQDNWWVSLLRDQSTIRVPYGDRALLMQRLSSMPHLPSFDLPPDLRVEHVRLQPQGRFSILASKTNRRSLRDMFAQVSFDYGDHRFRLEDQQQAFFDSARERFISRDRDAERNLVQELKKFGIGPVRGWQSGDADVAFKPSQFLDLIHGLSELGWIVESEGQRIRQAGEFQLNVSTGVDWFELDGQFDFGGASATLPALLQAVRAGDRYVQLDDGSQGILPEAWLQKYGRLAKLGTTKGDTLRFISSQALLLDALLAEQENVQVDQSFELFREKLRSFDGVKPLDEPPGFCGELRGYQRDGVGWLQFLREFGFGGCLADDMGLGKTVQVLAMLQSRSGQRRANQASDRSPSIVVVPKSLVFNWIDEACKFTPELRVLNYTGVDRASVLKGDPEYDVLVTTYGTLRRDILELKERHFDYAILDESQAIKNHNSQAAKACRLIQADHRLAMTGTPVENHLGELWSLFEFLNPGMLGSSTAFATLAKSSQHAEGHALPLLSRALRPFVLRRNKREVLTELPEKTEQTVLCEMPPQQRKYYDELREYYRVHLANRVEQVGLKKSKIHVLEALLRLRQVACHPGLLDKEKVEEPSAKLESLLEQLTEVMAEDHKALVFSQFTSLLAIVRKKLDARQIRYEYLDGRTRKRAERVKRFQEDDTCRLFLISLKAGGHGLNLTAADYVFILDPWWNPAVEAQAVDRAHRIGQQRPVFAYRLICRDSVEEKILELQQEKRELADAIVSADSSIMRNLTSEDLQLLLS